MIEATVIHTRGDLVNAALGAASGLIIMVVWGVVNARRRRGHYPIPGRYDNPPAGSFRNIEARRLAKRATILLLIAIASVLLAVIILFARDSDIHGITPVGMAGVGLLIISAVTGLGGWILSRRAQGIERRANDPD